MISEVRPMKREVPTKKAKFTTYLLPQVGEILDRLAREERRTQSQLLNNLIEDVLIAKGLATREQIDQWNEEFNLKPSNG